MVYYKPIKVTINVAGLAKIIINIVVRHHGLLKSIINDKNSIFILKFWFLLSYFFNIKPKLYNAFHSQMNGQIKGQNSTMEVYLQVFGN